MQHEYQRCAMPPTKRSASGPRARRGLIVDDAFERRPHSPERRRAMWTLLHRETANGVEARVFALRDGSGAEVPEVSTAPEGR